MITGPTTGVMKTVAAEIHVDHRSVENIGKGTRFSIPVPGKIRPSDKLYKWVDASQVKTQ
jgi:putative protease